MEEKNLLNGLATFSAGYLKRWLEGNFYDKIFKTELGEKLKSLDKKTRYGIEFGLNLLTAFFDQKLAEDTALKKFVKEIGLDVGPETSKRLINNTKERLNSNAKTSEEKGLVGILLELNDQTLLDLLNWLYDIEISERDEIKRELSRLSIDEIARLAKLEPDDRKKLLGLLKTQEKRSSLSLKVEHDIQRATAKIEAFSKKLDERWMRRRRK